MPVAIPLAAAGIAAGGSILAANAQKKAANKATDAASQTAAANNALQREIYGQNTANLSPFMQRGNAAGGALNALLGLGGGATDFGGYVNANPDVMNEWRTQHAGTAGPYADINAYGQYHYNNFGQGEGRQLPSATGAAENAFEQFRNSTGYQFRQDEGQRSVMAGLGKSGFLDSGAAQKSLARYGQNFASNEFGNYANMLSGQQQVGLSGANALAGVGTNFAGAVGANNDSAGSAAANNALAGGAAAANMYGGIASSLGNAFGQLGSSYGGAASNQSIFNASPALQGNLGFTSMSPWGR